MSRIPQFNLKLNTEEIARHMKDPNLMPRTMQYSDKRKLDVIYTRLRLGCERTLFVVTCWERADLLALV